MLWHPHDVFQGEHLLFHLGLLDYRRSWGLHLVGLHECSQGEKHSDSHHCCFIFLLFWTSMVTMCFSLFQEKYGIEPTMVVHGVKMLYVPVIPGHSKRLKLTWVLHWETFIFFAPIGNLRIFFQKFPFCGDSLLWICTLLENSTFESEVTFFLGCP